MKNKTIKYILQQIEDGKIISNIELQRDLVYSDTKLQMVIDSVLNNIPLPAFYFWENENGDYEVLDGKQRLHALNRFKTNDLEYEGRFWRETAQDVQDKINNTELSVIVSCGEDSLKREIFYRINTLGVPLNNFEVANGLYHGIYIDGIKSAVKNEKAVGRVLGTNMRGKHEYEILKLVSGKSGVEDVLQFLKENKDNDFENDWKGIVKEIRFIDGVFKTTKDLKILWKLAKNYVKDISIWKDNKDKINKWIADYIKTDSYKLDTKKYETYRDGILALIEGITTDPQRLFNDTQKKQLIEEFGLNCNECGNKLEIHEATFDHIEPWSKGGSTIVSNGQILCSRCNSKKGNK